MRSFILSILILSTVACNSTNNRTGTHSQKAQINWAANSCGDCIIPEIGRQCENDGVAVTVCDVDTCDFALVCPEDDTLCPIIEIGRICEGGKSAVTVCDAQCNCELICPED